MAKTFPFHYDNFLLFARNRDHKKKHLVEYFCHLTEIFSVTIGFFDKIEKDGSSGSL